jgi:selenocysteine lyase/cysteine desulfurase
MPQDARRPPATGRRDFALRLAATGAAAVLPGATGADTPPAIAPAPASPGEGYWESVRARFVQPPDLAVMNAANLCPSPIPVIEAVAAATRDVDRDPSFPNRVKMAEGNEATRRLLAAFLRVTPEEIVIARNTSEANNLVSTGLALGPGDEVVLFADNHPSNLDAWKVKAARAGYAVKVVPQVNPHPGPEYYVEAFLREITPRTRLLGFTHLTSTVGDLFPAAELCRLARAKGVLTLVDGAQTLGLLDVDLGAMAPDFYTASGHKWPCGPREVGVLYVSAAAQARLAPSIVSVYPGAVGLSKTFETFGQRDEAAMIGLGEALRFQSAIGRAAIEARARELGQALIAGLRAIDGVRVWTSPDPTRSAAVVSFQPGSLDVARLSAALYERDRVAGAPRPGPDRPGLRFSPHFYNLHAEVDRAVAAVRRYMRTGV